MAPIARNWRLKLAAFGLTVFLWALVRSEPSARGDVFTVPVRAQIGDLDWTLIGDPTPATVQVRFRGPTDDLIRLAREGTSLRLPLDSVSAADTTVQLRRDWVVLASGSGLVVEDIFPGTVRLRLEPTLSVPLPLRVSTRGELRGGMALAAPLEVTPPSVRVSGPARHVRMLDSIALAVLDLGGVDESGVYPIAVDTAGLGGLSVTPLSLALGIRLEPAIERELAGVPVVPGAAADGAVPGGAFVIVPPTIHVRLSGARTPVTATDAALVRAVVAWESVANLAPGQERRVPILLRGLPALVRGYAAVDSVLVRR